MEDVLKHVKLSQSDDTEMLGLIKAFEPLLKKYARILNYEDAFYDLQLKFIDFIYKFDTDSFSPKNDKYVLAYISKSIKNKFSTILAQKKFSIIEYKMCDLSDVEKENVEIASSCMDSYINLYIEDIQKVLSEHEFIIFYETTILGKTSQYVATKMGVTRQAVNQNKRRSQSKLRKLFKV